MQWSVHTQRELNESTVPVSRRAPDVCTHDRDVRRSAREMRWYWLLVHALCIVHVLYQSGARGQCREFVMYLLWQPFDSVQRLVLEDGGP